MVLAPRLAHPEAPGARAPRPGSERAGRAETRSARSAALTPLLDAVPDLGRWTDLVPWSGEVAARAASLDPGCDLVPLEVASLLPARLPELGAVSVEGFRRAVVAAWAADRMAYPPAHRVGLPRLLHVMETFPAGFRLWMARERSSGTARRSAHGAGHGGEALPVGYTGWFPIAERTFEILTRDPAGFHQSEQLIPLRRAGARPWLFVYNYSMAPPLRGGGGTRRMLQGLRADLEATHPAGLAALTVSDDGRRVAERFGMRHVGDIADVGVDGSPAGEAGRPGPGVERGESVERGGPCASVASVYAT